MTHLQIIHRPLAANASAHPWDVLKAKSILATTGHYDAPEWGLSEFPDPALYGAITKFQKAHRLKTDGVMKPGGETEHTLLSTLSVGQTASAIHAAAQAIQDMGRNGDALLAHLSREEAQLLDAITDGGSVNPHTGLLEFFWGSDDDDDPDDSHDDTQDTGGDVGPDDSETMDTSDHSGGSSGPLGHLTETKQDRPWSDSESRSRKKRANDPKARTSTRLLETKPPASNNQAPVLDEDNQADRRARQLQATQQEYDPSFTAGFFEKNTPAIQVAEAKTPEQKAYERYYRQQGHSDYEYGGNNFSTGYNNPASKGGSIKAGIDAFMSEFFDHGGETLSTVGPKGSALLGMPVEEYGEQLGDKFNAPTYDPRDPGFYKPRLDLLKPK